MAAFDMILHTAGPELLMEIKKSPRFDALCITEEKIAKMQGDGQREAKKLMRKKPQGKQKTLNTP